MTGQIRKSTSKTAAQTPDENQMAGPFDRIGSGCQPNPMRVCVCVCVCDCMCAHSQNGPFPKIHQLLHSYRPRPDNDPRHVKELRVGEMTSRFVCASGQMKNRMRLSV